MLPPRLPHRSPHRYGTLALSLRPHTEHPPHALIPLFLGAPEKPYPVTGPVTFMEFPIVTNLWHFYAYLADCRTLPIHIYTQHGTFTANYPISLLPSRQVLTPAVRDVGFLAHGGYVLEGRKRVEVGEGGREGWVEVEMTVKFDEQMHKTLWDAGVVDLEDILVIDEISPIGSIC